MGTTGRARGIRATAVVALAAAFALCRPALAADPWVAQPTWSNPENGSVTVGDLDGDGKPDLMFGHNTASGLVTAYRNTGTAASPAWTAAPASWTTFSVCDPNGVYMPTLVDLNGDGLLDLVVGSHDFVCMYQNTGTGTPGDPPVWTRNTAWEAGLSGLVANRRYTPAFGDLDGDGKLDLMVLNQTNDLAAYKNTGTAAAPAWTEEPAWVPSRRPRGTQPKLALADLDGNGTTDFVETVGSDGYVYAYQNSGSSTSPQWTYAPGWTLLPSGASASTGVALADLNADGKPDLVRSSAAGTDIYQQSPSGMGSAGNTSGLPPVTGLVTDSFDSFTCPGSWQPDPSGPNSSYSRDCGDGWTAYAEDMSNTLLTPSPLYAGPVGDQNVVTLDSSANGPSAASATPSGAALMNTAPGNAPAGVLWLLKSFPVQPGVPVQVIKADVRAQYTGSGEYYSFMVFDGRVTSPYGQTDAANVPLRSDLLAIKNYYSSSSSTSGTCAGVAVGQWCPWQETDLVGQNYLVPSTSYITVAFRLNDTSASYQPFAEIDNVVVSNVTSAAGSPVPVNDIAQLWSAGYTAGGTDNMASAADILTDAAGNAYVTGTFNSGTNYDIVTVKYDDTGTPVSPWPVTYDGGDDDQAVAMTADASGNINIVGRSYNGTDNDYVVLKYDTGGTLLWSATYDNAGRDDVPTGLGVDGSGNVYVTGRSCATTGACDYATVAFGAGAGNRLWAKTYDGGGDDEATAIQVDGTGNVYVTGRSAGTSDDMVTIKYDSAGTQLWETRYDKGSNEGATALAVDSSGNCFVTGTSFSPNAGSPALLVLKYGPNGGAPLWVRTYGGGNTRALPAAMVVDAGGSVYVTGRTGQVTNQDMVTLKYLSDGTLAWAQTYGNSGLDDRGVDMAVGANGDVYVLGTLTSVKGNSDFVTVKYDGAGVAQNAITYDGSAVADTPAALALGVDAQGDTTAYVTGTSSDNATGITHIETVRYEKAQPDLTMTQLSGPASGVINGTIGVANTVLNVADLANKIYADSGVFTVDFYLAPSVSGSPDLSQLTLIGTRSISNITPGASDAQTTTLTIPAATAAGDYFLVALADAAHQVVEADETNNQLVSSSSIALAAPDLTVSKIDAPTSMDHTQSFDVTVTVSNVASSATPPTTPFRVGIYASAYPDATVTTSDTLIGSYTISTIAGLSDDTTVVTIPANTLAPGQYYIGAIADDQNNVVEADETNNSAVLQAPAGNNVLLTSDTDFNPGLAVSDPVNAISTQNVAVSGTGDPASVTLAKNTGTTVLQWQAKSAWNAPGGNYGLGDIDGDGRLDLVTGSANANAYVYAYKNTGTATAPAWTEEPAWEITTTSQQCTIGITQAQYSRPRLADLNGDGIPDLVVGTRQGVCIYENTGTASSPTWTRNSTWEGALTSLPLNRFYTVALGDLNGDGKPDLMIKGAAYENTGSTTVPAWTRNSAWDAPASDVVALGDMDGDGLIDLMQGQSAGGEVFGYRNTGTATSPTWTAHVSWDVTGLGSGSNTGTAPEVGDLDGDGRPDILVDNAGTDKAFKNGTAVPYVTSGTYLSNVIDAGVHGGYTTLSYAVGLPEYTTLTVYIRAGDTATPDSAWTTWTSVPVNGDISSLGTRRYVQYRADLTTSDVTVTSQLDSIEAHKLAPGLPQSSVVSVLAGRSSGGGQLSPLALLALALFLTRRRSRGRTSRSL